MRTLAQDIRRCVISNPKSEIRNPKSGFTLVELLVVIAIISILAAMTTVVITKVMVRVDEVRTVSEIQQLAQSVEAFKLSYGSYPPSTIKLRERGGYTSDPIDVYSVQWLQRLFTNIDLELYTTTASLPQRRWHNWDGILTDDGAPTDNGTVVTLQGDECLVFFLGGMTYRSPGKDGDLFTPDEGGILEILNGFCRDKSLPTQRTVGRPREGPFYEFNTGRLRLQAERPEGDHRYSYAYFDHYGKGPDAKPYLYFIADPPGTVNNYRINPCDCAFATGFPSTSFIPYCESGNLNPPNPSVRFHRADKFQIISAGRDHAYGAGGLYNRSDTRALTPADKDNLTNFSEGRLETGQ